MYKLRYVQYINIILIQEIQGIYNILYNYKKKELTIMEICI